MNQRQERLLMEYMAADGAFFRDGRYFMMRDVAFYEAWKSKKNYDFSHYELQADIIYGLADKIEQEWEEESLIQGRHLCDGSARFDGWRKDIAEKKKIDRLRELKYDIQLQELHDLLQIFLFNSSCLAAGDGMQLFNDSQRFFIDGLSTFRVSVGTGCIINHSVRGYHILLQKGFGGLLKEIRRELERFPFGSVEYVERESFLAAEEKICASGLLLGRKLADIARNHGREDIAANCLAVENGAFSLASAVQLLWLGHIIAVADDGLNANSIGRLDQLLYPYYKMDAAKGRCDEDAHELMVDLAIKLYQDYDVQAVTLGGCDAEGRNACNAMTGIILDATYDFGKLRDLSLRICDGMPDDIMEKAAKLVLRGGGIPYFLNDKCFIKALVDRGTAVEDARNYAPIGCIEISIPGKANSRAVSGWFNLLKVLELTINGGIDMTNGEVQLPSGKLLTDYTSYGEFEEAFLNNMRTCALHMVYNCRCGEKNQRVNAPLLSFSLLTESCIRKGRDITDGGADYNWHSVCLMAVPDVADSLMAIKKLVFREKKISAACLLEALRNDFADSESLRQMLIHDAPKYGNDIEEVDMLAAKISGEFIKYMDAISEENSKFFVHLFSFYVNVGCGAKTGASPNGRHQGMPFAYSLSAHPGYDINGVSSMLRSLSRQPHDMAAGASAAIIDLHPTLLNSKDPVATFLALQKSAFDMGVGQVQWNIVSADDMLKAQEDPEKYGNLHVRVAGYSQMFKLIPYDLQMHLISRTKHLG